MRQNDLILLFDELKINNAFDYRQLDFHLKTYFISRLYKFFIYSSQYKEVIDMIEKEKGVKFHFDCPNKSFDYKKLNTFSKKISFFSDKTLLTVPLIGEKYTSEIFHDSAFSLDNKNEQIYGDIETERKKYLSNKIKTNKPSFYVVNKKEIDHLINVITSCKESIRNNDILIISDLQNLLQPRLRKINNIIAANFKFEDLKTQFFEYNVPLDDYYGNFLPPYQLLLPTFCNVPSNYLLEIRETEKELYNEFHLRLKNILLSKPDTEEELYDHLVQIDIDIKRINNKFKQLIKHYKRKNIFALMTFSSLPIMLIIPEIQNVAAWVIPHLGGTLAQYLISENDKKSKEKKLEDQEHYLMWQIHKHNNYLP